MDLRGAKLFLARLKRANLQGADLREAKLEGARNLSEVRGVPASLPEGYELVEGEEYNAIVKSS